MPVQNPDDVPAAKPESHSNMFTSPPLVNVFGDPTAATTLPPTPAPTSPDTPPPPGNPAKMLTSNSEIPHVVTIMIERLPILISLVCVKDKRFLNTDGFHTKTGIKFRYRDHDVDETCIVS